MDKTAADQKSIDSGEQKRRQSAEEQKQPPRNCPSSGSVGRVSRQLREIFEKQSGALSKKSSESERNASQGGRQREEVPYEDAQLLLENLDILNTIQVGKLYDKLYGGSEDSSNSNDDDSEAGEDDEEDLYQNGSDGVRELCANNLYEDSSEDSSPYNSSFFKSSSPSSS